MDRMSIKNLIKTINRDQRRKAKNLVKISQSLQVGKNVLTLGGYSNKILKRDKENLYFRAADSIKINCIPIDKIIYMVSYFFRVRIVERKELEVFHKFNSMMFGILRALFFNQSKISKIKNLYRLFLSGTRIFFSGGERSKSELSIIANNTGRYVMFSYYSIRNGNAWKNYLQINNMRCLLDSGAYSEWMAKTEGKKITPIDIDEYIAFIKENIDLLDGYFCLDDCLSSEKTFKNLQYMESKMLTPIPVFHMGENFRVLEDLVQKGYPVIGIGGTVNKEGVNEFLKRLFVLYPEIPFHGLGITKSTLLLRYPFFTVDSSSWTYCRRKKVRITLQGQIKHPENINNEELLGLSIKCLTSLERPNVIRRIRSRINDIVTDQLTLFDIFDTQQLATST